MRSIKAIFPKSFVLIMYKNQSNFGANAELKLLFQIIFFVCPKLNLSFLLAPFEIKSCVVNCVNFNS